MERNKHVTEVSAALTLRVCVLCEQKSSEMWVKQGESEHFQTSAQLSNVRVHEWNMQKGLQSQENWD